MLIAVSRFLCLLPISWVLAMGRAVGWLWYYLIPVRVGVVKANMRQVYGDSITQAELNHMAKRCCQNLAMNILEGFTIPNLRKPGAAKRFDIENIEIFEEATSDGKGACVVSLHLGNFELMIAQAAVMGFPINIIYRQIHWQSAHDFWGLIRESTGIKAISHRRSKERIKQVLAQGEYVGFASDQHMPAHRGIACEFMGQLAATTPAAARFALETGANVVMAYTTRHPDDPTIHRVRFEKLELECPHDTQAENIQHNTQRISDWMGTVIKAHPEQWLWQHKRFKISQRLHEYSIPDYLQHHIQ